jgi:hypothetical protein
VDAAGTNGLIFVNVDLADITMSFAGGNTTLSHGADSVTFATGSVQTATFVGAVDATVWDLNTLTTSVQAIPLAETVQVDNTLNTLTLV